MRTRIILSLMLIMGVSLTSFACSCKWNGPFLKVSYTTKLVAIVRVKKHLTFNDIYNEKTPMSMEIEIIEVLWGKETRKTVTVWGDDGVLCRPYLTRFKEGTIWVLALYAGNEGWGHKNETANDYSVSICGEYWLRVKNNNVYGVIEGKNKYRKNGNENRETLSLQAFRAKFRKNRPD